MNSLEVYSLAIGANLAYSSASMVFSLYAKRFSSLWINIIKVSVALICFLTATLVFQSWKNLSDHSTMMLIFSGMSGLFLGDLFLYRAFATLGAARSLVLYSFQPLMVGLYGYFFLKQIFTPNQLIAVLCMIFCIFIFMYERIKATGSWDLKSFFWAFAGITFDAIGLMMSRSAFESTPEIDTFQVNLIRCSGAILAYFIVNPIRFRKIGKEFFSLPKKDIALVVGAATTGCFLSLTMYMAALKHAHVGTLTSIAITGPVWVSMLECLYYRKWPNRYLVIAFVFFLTGFYLMVS